MTATRIEARLPARPEAAVMARRALAPFAGRISEERMADLKLLVSELVTNSIRHARLPDASSISLSARLIEGRIRVEVADPGEGFERPPALSDPSALSGWGLFLVEQIADRWGIEGGDRTTVWFDLTLEA